MKLMNVGTYRSEVMFSRNILVIKGGEVKEFSDEHGMYFLEKAGRLGTIRVDDLKTRTEAVKRVEEAKKKFIENYVLHDLQHFNIENGRRIKMNKFVKEPSDKIKHFKKFFKIEKDEAPTKTDFYENYLKREDEVDSIFPKPLNKIELGKVLRAYNKKEIISELLNGNNFQKATVEELRDVHSKMKQLFGDAPETPEVEKEE
jgi:hypothetical protein